MSVPWKAKGYKPKDEYDAMRYAFFRCWACFADRKPRTYYGPWLIERAHIVNKPRKEDRRAVVMLCSVCHKANHGERIVGHERPRLTTAMMLFLKQQFDPQWFDLQFMQGCSVRILPEPQTLPVEYLALRESSKIGKVI